MSGFLTYIHGHRSQPKEIVRRLLGLSGACMPLTVITVPHCCCAMRIDRALVLACQAAKAAVLHARITLLAVPRRSLLVQFHDARCMPSASCCRSLLQLFDTPANAIAIDRSMPPILPAPSLRSIHIQSWADAGRIVSYHFHLHGRCNGHALLRLHLSIVWWVQ